MTNLPINPLAGIIAAAQKLPAQTGATERAAAERARPARQIILADVSSSMREPAGTRRKIDVLRTALERAGDSAEIVAFGSSVLPVARHAELPEPGGSTALHLALDYCRRATSILIISDGHPDDPEAALAVASQLQARIDIIYCGPEHDHEGLAFMRRLARGGGTAHRRSLSDPAQIGAVIERLALPPSSRR